MRKLRSCLLLVGAVAALLIPVNAYARGGGGRGGGGGGRGGGGGGRGGGGGGGGGGGANQAAAQDQAQITQLQASLTTISDQIASAVKVITDDFHKTQEFIDAQKVLDAATNDLHKARDAVIEKLKTQPDYKSATGKEKAAQDKLATIKDNGGTRDEISKQAQVILDAGGVVSKIEKDALDKDQNYQDCLKKVADASAAMKVETDKLADNIKNDSNVAGLKSTQDSTKSQLVAAQAQLQQDLANPPAGGGGGGGRGGGRGGG